MARVLRTPDGGVIRTDVSGTLSNALPALPVNSIVVDRCDMDTVFLANDIGVFRTAAAAAAITSSGVAGVHLHRRWATTR